MTRLQAMPYVFTYGADDVVGTLIHGNRWSPVAAPVARVVGFFISALVPGVALWEPLNDAIENTNGGPQ